MNAEVERRGATAAVSKAHSFTLRNPFRANYEVGKINEE